MKLNNINVKKIKNIMNSKKIKEAKRECELCKAGFEAWLATSNINSEREEKIRNRIFGYCPACKIN